jgi:hypothetical protein
LKILKHKKKEKERKKSFIDGSVNLGRKEGCCLEAASLWVVCLEGDNPKSLCLWAT